MMYDICPHISITATSRDLANGRNKMSVFSYNPLKLNRLIFQTYWNYPGTFLYKKANFLISKRQH